AGMEEIEFDRLGDIRLQRPDGFRSARGQYGDARLREMALEAPHRRKGDDAIADVVELDDEDFANFVAVERVAAGDQEAVRFGVRREIVLMAREMRVEIRVAGQEKIAPFAGEGGGVVDVRHRSAADGLIMDQAGMWRVDGNEPFAARAQAIIEVIVDDE